jgi:hypothetical protein
VSGYIPVLTAPGDPGSVSGFTDTSTANTVTLNWQPPISDGGSPITGYLVSRNGSDTTGYGAYSTVLAATASSVVFDKLISGTPYDVVVAPINAVGEGTTHTDTISTSASVTPRPRRACPTRPTTAP